MKRKISICIPCFNEVGNVLPMTEAIIAEMEKLTNYSYEIIFADNASTDGTQDVLRKIAQQYSQVKVIINARNYGPSRSPRNAMKYVTGNAVLSIACDFQDPPSMIPMLIKYWEDGYLAVYGQKVISKEGYIKHSLRTVFYNIIDFFSDYPQYHHISGICLNDSKIIEELFRMDSTVPPRFLLAEMGINVKLLPYTQDKRRSGKSSYNIGKLFDFTLTSLISVSTVPLRVATVVGIFISFICFLVGLVYFIFKLKYWNTFNAGMAPLVIGMFFLGSLQLIFIGLLGEYVGAIYRALSPKPPVEVKELINFDDK